MGGVGGCAPGLRSETWGARQSPLSRTSRDLLGGPAHREEAAMNGAELRKGDNELRRLWTGHLPGFAGVETPASLRTHDRAGRRAAGAKAHFHFQPFSARVNSCPDTNHFTGRVFQHAVNQEDPRRTRSPLRGLNLFWGGFPRASLWAILDAPTGASGWGGASGVPGFPPIPQNARNGWGTGNGAFWGIRLRLIAAVTRWERIGLRI